MDNDPLNEPDLEKDEKAPFSGDRPQSLYDDLGANDLGPRKDPNKDSKPKSLTPQGLKAAEEGAADKGALNSSAVKGTGNPQASGSFKYNAADSEGKSLKDRIGRLRGSFTKRRAIAGGGLAAVLITFILLLLGAGSAELINVKENLVGFNGNALQNQVLKGRHEKALTNILETFKNNGGKTLEEGISEQKFADALSEQGFEVEFDEAGNLTKFAFEGRPPVNLAAEDLNDELTNYLADGGPTEAAFEKVFPTIASVWRGGTVDSLYKRLGLSLGDWIDSAIAKFKPNETETEEVADIGQASEATDAGTAVPDSAEAALEEAGQNQGFIGDEATASLDNSEALANGADLTGKSALDIVKEEAGPVAAEIGVGGTAKLALSGAAGAIDPLLTAQTLCKAKGFISFFSDYQNILLTIELTRFTVNYLRAADDEKAGILTSEGLSVYMNFLHRKDANGKNYLSGGGILSLMGNKNAQASSADLTRFSAARSSGGILGNINRLANDVPGASKTCGVANNLLANLGAGVAGGLFAIFGGSESGASESLGAGKVFANILIQIALDIAKPIITQVFFHQVLQHVVGPAIGDALGSGFGSLKASEGGVNGLRPTTTTQASKILSEAQASHEHELAQESAFQRYFALDNSDSLISHMGLAIESSPFNSVSSLPSIMTKVFNLSLFSSVFSSLFPGTSKAYAQAQIQSNCNSDPQMQALKNAGYELSTDQFCNIDTASTPPLDINQTKQILLGHKATNCNGKLVPAPLITPDGKPVSYQNTDTPCAGDVKMNDDLGDYVAYCQIGREGILYDNSITPKYDGSDPPAAPSHLVEHDPNTDYKQPCVLPGDPLANDSSRQGRFLRYATWYGYMTDLQSISDTINENYNDNTPWYCPISTTPNICQ